ncbi:MAG: hypothetical protein ACP5JR_02625, partial [Thermoplasmata archaeon]
PTVEPTPPMPVVIKENLGMDIARVYIDLLNSTINTFNPAMIAHGYMIELQGRDGEVISARAWKWENGQKAEEIPNPGIMYGLSNGKIEFSAAMSALAGIDNTTKFYFEMTNWMGKKDASEYAYIKDGERENRSGVQIAINLQKMVPKQVRVPIWIYGNITGAPALPVYIRITNLATGETVGSASSPLATDSTGYFATQLSNPGADVGDNIQIEVFSDSGYTTQLVVSPSVLPVTADDMNNPYIGGPAKDMSTTVLEVQFQFLIYPMILIGLLGLTAGRYRNLLDYRIRWRG